MMTTLATWYLGGSGVRHGCPPSRTFGSDGVLEGWGQRLLDLPVGGVRGREVLDVRDLALVEGQALQVRQRLGWQAERERETGPSQSRY